jgi:protein translocase SEC61 complex gamma subunit
VFVETTGFFLMTFSIVRALQATWRTLKLTRKSDRAEFFLYMKLVLIGFGIVGAIGFIIYFLASIIELDVGAVNTSSTTTAILRELLKSVL